MECLRNRFPLLGYDRQILGLGATYCGIEQAECKPASDVAEGAAVWLSMFLGNETCKPLEGNSDDGQPPLDDRTSGVNVPCSTSRMRFS